MESLDLLGEEVYVVPRHECMDSVSIRVAADNIECAHTDRTSRPEDGDCLQLPYYIVNTQFFTLSSFAVARQRSQKTTIRISGLWTPSSEETNPFGRRGGLLQGSLYEVSLALVGVASPAYFQF